MNRYLVAALATPAALAVTAGQAVVSAAAPASAEAPRSAAVDARHPSGQPPEGDRTVVFWQDRLNTWLQLTGSELFPIPVDGSFGPETDAATRQFQDTYPGLQTTGVVTDLDRVALDDAIASIQATGQAPVPGVDQAMVFWQDRLNTWLQLTGSELPPIAVDGVFGPETEEATRQFQDSYPGLETTGVVTDVDRVALDDAITHTRATGQAPPPGGELAIAYWQDNLNTWLRLTGSELFPIPVDGVMGPETVQATTLFQDAYPGVETTGVVTDLDRVALEGAIQHLRS